jgi:hypothetical protein
MNAFKTLVEFDSLHDYNEVAVEVEYDYQPAERATSTYPGCDESVVINEVIREDTGRDILADLHPDALENLRIEILEHEANRRAYRELSREAAREDYLDMRAEMRREERT